MSEKKYLLLDSGDGRKLEKVGDFCLVRPCALAIWKPSLDKKRWDEADASFSREKENLWFYKNKVPESWKIKINDLHFKISLTDFGHLGIFPEHFSLFDFMEKKIKSKSSPSILNLFAYTGGATLAAARSGAKVCHLDASTKAVSWAKENASLSNLDKAPIRYIVDDAMKFLKREVRRNNKYDGIILDPPSFGRGTSGQVFKIEKDLFELLTLCKELLSDDPLFLILTCHTPGFSPSVLESVASQVFQGKCSLNGKEVETNFTSGEMYLKSVHGIDIPSGSYLIWEGKKDDKKS